MKFTALDYVFCLVTGVLIALVTVIYYEERELDTLRHQLANDGQPDLHWQAEFNRMADAHRALRVSCGKEMP